MYRQPFAERETKHIYDMNPFLLAFLSLFLPTLELMIQGPRRGDDLVLSACYLNES